MCQAGAGVPGLPAPGPPGVLLPRQNGGIQGTLAPTTLPPPRRPLASLCQPQGQARALTVPLCKVMALLLMRHLRNPRERLASLGAREPREGRRQREAEDSGPGTGQKPPRRAVPASREPKLGGAASSSPWCPEQPCTLLTSQAALPTPTLRTPPAAAPHPGTVWTWTLCAPARALASLSHGHSVPCTIPALSQGPDRRRPSCSQQHLAAQRAQGRLAWSPERRVDSVWGGALAGS